VDYSRERAFFLVCLPPLVEDAQGPHNHETKGEEQGKRKEEQKPLEDEQRRIKHSTTVEGFHLVARVALSLESPLFHVVRLQNCSAVEVIEALP
jgi:hypothetical protein